MSQLSLTALKLDAAEAQGLKHGINFKKTKDGKCFIIYKDKDVIRACRNQCKHQGGLFNQDMEDMDSRTVRCSKHFWKLNVATMEYVNPPDSFTQDELDNLGPYDMIKDVLYLKWHFSCKRPSLCRDYKSPFV